MQQCRQSCVACLQTWKPRLHAYATCTQDRLTGNTALYFSRTSFAATSGWSAWLRLFSMAMIWLTELPGGAAVPPFGL